MSQSIFVHYKDGRTDSHALCAAGIVDAWEELAANLCLTHLRTIDDMHYLHTREQAFLFLYELEQTAAYLETQPSPHYYYDWIKGRLASDQTLNR